MWYSPHPQVPVTRLNTEHWRGYSLQDGYQLADPLADSLAEPLAYDTDFTEGTLNPTASTASPKTQPLDIDMIFACTIVCKPGVQSFTHWELKLHYTEKPNIVPTTQSNTQWPLHQKSILVFQTTHCQQFHPFYS